jgi:hypothetical protein
MMRKRTKLLYSIFAVGVLFFILSKKLFIIFLACNILIILFGYLFIILNKAVKRTNWYKNIFIFTTQFVSNAGYRDDLQRNYDIINLGSNPARFAFFYESVLGQNWSTGTQGLVEDLKILKRGFLFEVRILWRKNLVRSQVA